MVVMVVYLERSPDPYQFPLSLIEKAVTVNQTMVKCRGIKDVHISAIAPDVSLAEFKGARVTYSDIKIVKQIGEGGFAKVYKVPPLCILRSKTTRVSIFLSSLGWWDRDRTMIRNIRREIIVYMLTIPSSRPCGTMKSSR